MPWAFGGGHGVSIPHQRRGIFPLFRQLLPSACIAQQGTNDGATAASNRHDTYELWSTGLRKVKLASAANRPGTCACCPYRTKGGVIGP
jgi:hypothetical protein